MSTGNLPSAPPHRGKMHKKRKVKAIGQPRKRGYLRMRMRADDSHHVNMTDRSLSSGISSE
jgi:hypothetical protein